MAKQVLIVEDDLGLSQLLAEHLRRWGYDPHVLNEGQDAVNWVRINLPEVVLLDLLLPDVDGFTICETLKLDRETNLIPIVMITALAGEQDKVHGLQVGANRYLTKPFATADLQRTIQEATAWKEDLIKRGAKGEIRFQLVSDSKYLEELNHLLASLFLFRV